MFPEGGGKTLGYAAIATLAALTSLAATAYAEKRPMALMIMVDGLRADAADSGRMPNLGKLRSGKWVEGCNAAWSLTAQIASGSGANDKPSSAPNHVSIATGYKPATHGAKANGQTSSVNYTAYPTWLKRVVAANPDAKALFVYSWEEDAALGPDANVEFMTGTDAENATALAARLAAADAPDATMYFIDCVDAAGHSSGYYPMSSAYLSAAATADGYIGACLDAIENRATFADEDWLVLVTSDHGGYKTYHGEIVNVNNQASWQAHTVPLVVAGSGVTAGRIPGAPYNYSVCANALAHFGITVPGMEATAVDGVAGTSRKLADGLAAYLPFNVSMTENKVEGSTVTPAKVGSPSLIEAGKFGNAVNLPGSSANDSIKLAGSESLTYEGGDKSFTAALWVKMSSVPASDPVVIANKKWSGNMKGALLCAGKAYTFTGTTVNAQRSSFSLNAGNSTDKARLDIGPFDMELSQWQFLAITRNDDGVLTIYQGRTDGTLGWASAPFDGFALKTGYPFYIGQDGTGTYGQKFAGVIDDAALWTRGLSSDEIRRIYEGGMAGKELGILLDEESNVPYARWTIDGDNPAASGWKFYNHADDTENTQWSAGVTSETEVRIFSYAEHQAVVAAGVSPSKYKLCGSFRIPADAAEWRLTTCVDEIENGAIFDVNGKKLYLDRFDFTGTVTDTSEGDPGELHVNVAQNETIDNALVALTGNFKLVKEGGGVLVLSRTGQTYSGGTEIAAGKIRLDATAGTNFGTGPVKVLTGGRLDMNAKDASALPTVLAGGALESSGTSVATAPKILSLEEDSTIEYTGNAGGNDIQIPNGCRWNLGGKTLSIVMSGNDSDFNFLAGSAENVVSNGSFTVSHVGTAGTGRGFVAIRRLNGRDGLKLDTGRTFLRLQNVGNTTHQSYVQDFTADPPDESTVYSYSSIRLHVYGTYTPPAVHNGFNMTMEDGSTLDLSGKSGAWNCTFSNSGGYAKGSAEPCTVQFASGTVALKLTGRTDLKTLAKSADPYVVKWSSQPAGTAFTLDAATGTRFKIQPDGTGVKLIRRNSLIIIVR